MRSRYLPVQRRGVLAALLVALAGCSDDPVTPPQLDGFVVTGTVTNRTGAEIPPGARVLVAWEVTATTPDYLYIFGEGELEDEGRAFRVEIDGAPPEAALNIGALGVGVIIVTADPTIGTGDHLDTVPEETTLGAAVRYGVIYAHPAADTVQLPEWVSRFRDGYGIGRGVDVEVGYDEFSPVAPDEVEIILDDLDPGDFVNWT